VHGATVADSAAAQKRRNAMNHGRERSRFKVTVNLCGRIGRLLMLVLQHRVTEFLHNILALQRGVTENIHNRPLQQYQESYER
jgi:hypothetical protein